MQQPDILGSSTVDLSECENEPIHRPGAIQPHGVLVAVNCDDFRIAAISDNVEAYFERTPVELLGEPLQVLLDDSDVNRLAVRLKDGLDERPAYLLPLSINNVEQPYNAIAHKNGKLLFVEFERSETGPELSPTDLYRHVQESIKVLHRSTSVEAICRSCAQQVRRVCGFDRVMVYRFDEEWNGQVVAEDRRDDLEPFLGLHYPASDIPSQARELYTKNWLRFICNRDYQASTVICDSKVGSSTTLDMSYSVLRSVSPVHLEYLRNMGVVASMSISLVLNGRLWGLIACHHYSPRFVRYDIRTACELLGQVMSLSISVAADRERDLYTTELTDAANLILEKFEQSGDVTKSLIEGNSTMLSLIPADGAAVVVGEMVTRIGHTPGNFEIEEITKRISPLLKEGVFSTDNLSSISGSSLLGAVAGGLLAVSLTASRPHFLLWFRSEQIRNVDWAGDPRKSVTKGDGTARLSPRGSFALWRETVRGRSSPWSTAELEAARLLRDGIVRKMLRRGEEISAMNNDLVRSSNETLRILQSERAARAEIERVSRMKDEFVATLSHELRTPLNAILGWAQILSMTAVLPPEMAQGVEVITRNARAQAQMIEDLLDVSRIISGKLRLDLQNVYLPKIVADAIETVQITADNKGVRIDKLIDPLIGLGTTGDPVRLQQIVWNLLSNAVKFTPKGGRVQVTLMQVDSHIEIVVSDTGQGIDNEFLPHVFDRFRQADGSATRKHGGLGLGLSIVRNLVELHGGNVLAFSAGQGKGSMFSITLPIRVVKRTSNEQADDQLLNVEPSDLLNLSGVRVVVVDDELDARLVLERIFDGAGCTVYLADSLESCLQVILENEVDILVSDVGMPGGDGYDLIKRLRELEAKLGKRKLPAIALTAYARAEDRKKALLSGFQAHVAKPVESGELLALVASQTGRV